MIYLQLFISFFKVGLFSIGGGYAAMPLIQSEVVTGHSWLSINEFTDLITISQMTPGPIAVNSATFVGIRIAGIPGAVIATFGCILPSCFIVSLLAYIYHRYKNVSALDSVLKSLRPTVVALIGSAGISILNTVIFKEQIITGNTINLKSVNWIGFIIFVVAFGILRKFKYNPIIIMLCCGVAGLIIHMVIS